MKINTGARLRGFAAASLVCVMALAACGDSGTTGGKSNADLLKEAAANMKAATSYHMNADVTQDTSAVKIDGDLDLTKNNSKLSMEVEGQKVDVIIVDGKAYVSTDAGGNYMEVPDASQITGSITQFTGLWNTFSAEEVDKAKDALKDGSPATETLDGVSVKHMTANAKDLAALNPGGTSEIEGTIDLWVGPNDKPYVRKMSIDGTSGGKPVKGTFTWSKINEAMDIKAP
jgi:hypothetical protein